MANQHVMLNMVRNFDPDTKDSVLIDIIAAMYMDTEQKEDGTTRDFLNPDKEWEGADVLQNIAEILNDYGRVPTEEITL